MINDGISSNPPSSRTPGTLAAQSVTVIKAMAEGSEPEANNMTTQA